MSQGVSISYFDPFDIFDAVRDEFLKVLDLRNVHWKSENGDLKTINKISVRFITESNVNEKSIKSNKPFIRFLIITCKSIDDYRSKVRPLIRQWLSDDKSMETNADDYSKNIIDSLNSKPMILLYSNSEVVDSSLFKSTTLIEKFYKDFPNITTMEIKSVYKSPDEKDQFWLNLSQELKNFLLDIFEERLNVLQDLLENLPTISTNLNKTLILRENLLDLFSDFNILDKATEQLKFIEDISKDFLKNNKILKGDLEIPFQLQLSSESNLIDSISIDDLISNDNITIYQLHKYFFQKKLQLLQLEPSLTIRYYKTFKQLQDFIRNVDHQFIKDENFLLYKYHLFDRIILLLDEMKPKAIDSSYPAYAQTKAQLLISRRNCWLHGILLTTNYTIINKSYESIEGVNYKFDEISSKFENEDQFQNEFIELTKNIIEVCSNCDGKYERTIDLLSVEIGLIHYKRKEYEKAINVFTSAYEFYSHSNWNTIGLGILNVFVDSLNQCNGLEYLSIDGTQVPIATILCNAYLNIMKMKDTNSEKLDLWNKFINLLDSLNDNLFYECKKIFEITYEDKVFMDTKNTYSINVNIDSILIPTDIHVDSMNIELQNDKGERIKFTANDIQLFEGKNTCKLSSTHIFFDKFFVTKFDLNIGNTIFIKEFNISSSKPHIKIVPLYLQNNFSVSISQDRIMTLGKYNFHVSYSNIDKISSFKVKYDVLPEKMNDSYAISFSQTDQISSLEFNSDDKKIKIPYFLNKNSGSFLARITTIFYYKENPTVEYKEIKKYLFASHLPLSVSVEDIFKRDAFYFKFFLSVPTGHEPIILHQSSLTPNQDNSEEYKIFGNFKPNKPIYLKEGNIEDCLNSYRLIGDKFNSDDGFELSVVFNTLKEQLDLLVTETVLISGQVKWYEDFEKWKVYWETEILPLLFYDFDAFEKNRHIKLLPNSIKLYKLSRYFKQLGIERHVSEKIIQCLEDIEHGIKLSEIDVDAYSQNVAHRSLKIPVQLPEFEQLFHVEFSNTDDKDTLDIGVPVEYNVKVQSVGKKWNMEEDNEIYVLELLNSNEWLIHGKKRMKITTGENDFKIIVVPMKKGYLTLPKVEIFNIDGEQCCVDNPNAFETKLVF